MLVGEIPFAFGEPLEGKQFILQQGKAQASKEEGTD